MTEDELLRELDQADSVGDTQRASQLAQQVRSIRAGAQAGRAGAGVVGLPANLARTAVTPQRAAPQRAAPQTAPRDPVAGMDDADRRDLARARALYRAGNRDGAMRIGAQLDARLTARSRAQNPIVKEADAFLQNLVPLGDWAGAGLATAGQFITGQPANFDTNLARTNAFREETRQQAGGAALAGNIVGGLATGALLAPVAGALPGASVLAPSASGGVAGQVARGVGRGVALGAPAGAVSAVANETARTGDVERGLQTAGGGALAGAVGGVAGEGAFAALRAIGGVAVRNILRMQPGADRDRALGEAAQRTGMDSEALRTQLAQYQRAVQQDPALVELLDAPGQQAVRVATEAGPRVSRAVERGEQRVSQAQRDVQRGAISEGRAPVSGERVRNEASDAYTAALRPIETRPVALTPEIEEFLTDPDIAANVGTMARRRIQAAIRRENDLKSPNADVRAEAEAIPPLSIRDLENAATDLNKAFRTATGSAFEGRSFARQLRGLVADQHADYAGLTQRFAQQQDVADAVELGVTAAGKPTSSDAVVDAIQRTPPTAAAGVADGLRTRMVEVTDAGEAEANRLAIRLASDTNLQQRMARVLGAERVRALAALGQQLTQSRQSTTRAAGGPVMSQQEVDTLNSQIGGRFGLAALGGPLARANLAMNLRQLLQMSPEASERFVEAVFDRTPGVAERAIDALERIVGRERAARLLQDAVAPTEGATLAGVGASQEFQGAPTADPPLPPAPPEPVTVTAPDGQQITFPGEVAAGVSEDALLQRFTDAGDANEITQQLEGYSYDQLLSILDQADALGDQTLAEIVAAYLRERGPDDAR